MKQLLSAALVFFTLGVNAQTKKAPVKKAPVKATVPVNVLKNSRDSFSYAAGLNIAANMKDQGITDINAAIMQKAITDVFQNKTPLLTADAANASLQKHMMVIQQKKMAEQQGKSAAEKARGKVFLDNNKKRAGVVTLPSGLQYEIMKAGDANSIKATAADTVVVHYAGSFTDGREFESSVSRGEPVTFPVGAVIKGWTEILQLMPEGSKWKVFIPSDLAYGDMGSGAIPPGSTLIFEIEVLDVKPAAK
jgi:FKBP-type peptidyl-prolyl cis-trans isomerase FklB